MLLFDLLLSRRLAAKHHCMLWAVVLIGMACPFSVETPFGMQGRLGPLLSSIGFANKSSAGDLSQGDSPEVETFTFRDRQGRTRTLSRLAPSPDQPADAWSEVELHVTQPELAEDSADVSNDESSREVHGGMVEHPQAGEGRDSLQSGESRALYATVDDPAGIDTAMLVMLCIVAIWLLGAAGLMIRAAIHSFLFAVRLRKCETVRDQNVIDQVLRVCDQLRVARRPRLKIVPDLEVPAVFGVWRPTICLPSEALEQLSHDELRLVLLHESAHIKRRDGLLLSLAIVVRSLQWFNPLAWIAVARLRHYVEQAADAAALRKEPEQRFAEYGRLLLRFAAQQPASSIPAGLGLLFSSSGKALARRIHMLRAAPQRQHWAAQVAGLAAIVVLAACGLTDASRQRPAGLHQPSNSAQASSHLLDEGVLAPPRIPPQPPAVTKTYNVAAALKKIAETEPQCDPKQRLLSQFDPNTSVLDGNSLQLTCSESMHQQMQQTIDALAVSGCWVTQFEIHSGVADIRGVTTGIVDWTKEAVLPLREGGRFDFALPVVTSFSSSDKESQDELSIEFHKQQTSWRPLLGVKLSQQQKANFLRRCKLDVRTSMMEGPHVALNQGRTGHVINESQRPFVTGVRPVVGNDAIAFQPIIDVLSEGTRMMLRGVVEDEHNMAFQFRLATSNINDVTVAQLPFPIPGSQQPGAMVQVPMATNFAATARAKLKKSESLLLVAPMALKEEQQDGASMFFLISPSWKR